MRGVGGMVAGAASGRGASILPELAIKWSSERGEICGPHRKNLFLFFFFRMGQIGAQFISADFIKESSPVLRRTSTNKQGVCPLKG